MKYWKKAYAQAEPSTEGIATSPEEAATANVDPLRLDKSTDASSSLPAFTNT